MHYSYPCGYSSHLTDWLIFCSMFSVSSDKCPTSAIVFEGRQAAGITPNSEGEWSWPGHGIAHFSRIATLTIKPFAIWNNPCRENEKWLQPFPPVPGRTGALQAILRTSSFQFDMGFSLLLLGE